MVTNMVLVFRVWLWLCWAMCVCVYLCVCVCVCVCLRLCLFSITPVTSLSLSAALPHSLNSIQIRHLSSRPPSRRPPPPLRPRPPLPLPPQTSRRPRPPERCTLGTSRQTGSSPWEGKRVGGGCVSTVHVISSQRWVLPPTVRDITVPPAIICLSFPKCCYCAADETNVVHSEARNISRAHQNFPGLR